MAREAGNRRAVQRLSPGSRGELLRFLRVRLPEGVFDCIGAFELGGRRCACLEERFDGSGIVSGSTIPAVFGAVNGPAERRGMEVSVSRFQRRIVLQDELGHLCVAMKSGPVEGRSSMLATNIDG